MLTRRKGRGGDGRRGRNSARRARADARSGPRGHGLPTHALPVPDALALVPRFAVPQYSTAVIGRGGGRRWRMTRSCPPPIARRRPFAPAR